tara:strand:+ start:57 stop:686 length:630 start_codon:yes stop_codon:yes gene_type:complete
MKTILVYKYNGTTDLIQYETDSQLNSYLMKNIDTIETVEEVEAINLCAPVEVEEAPKAISVQNFQSVQNVIDFLQASLETNRIVGSETYTDLAPIIEFVVDRLITDNQLERIAIKRGIPVDTEETAVKLNSDSVIEWLKQNPSDVTEPIIEYILSHLSDDEILELADQNDLTTINDQDMAIDYLSDEGYACINTAFSLKESIEELINHF